MTDGIAPEPGILGARDACADVRARETEEQRSDEQRFALIVNGVSAGGVDLARGERIPHDVPRCAGYTPGTRRPGVPALLMSDASLG